MAFPANSIVKDGLARSPDGALYVTPSGTAAITGGSISGVSGVPTVTNASGLSVSGTAVTAEEVYRSVTLPAMQANDILRVTAVWAYTNSANNKTLRIRINGLAGTQIFGAIKTTTTNQSITMYIRNANATNSQRVDYMAVDSGGTFTSTTLGASAIETSAAGVLLVFTGEKASAGETCALQSSSVELIRQ